MPDEPRGSKVSSWWKWRYATRALGTFIVLFELVFQQGTPERGTIIVAGIGVFFADQASRRDRAER